MKDAYPWELRIRGNVETDHHRHPVGSKHARIDPGGWARVRAEKARQVGLLGPVPKEDGVLLAENSLTYAYNLLAQYAVITDLPTQ